MYSLSHYVQSLLKINVTFNLSGILSMIRSTVPSYPRIHTALLYTDIIPWSPSIRGPIVVYFSSH